MTDSLRSSIKLWPINWGCYLVRGTDHVEVAKTIVAQALTNDGYDTTEIEQWFDSHSAEVDWWRCNPCHCGEEHRFDMEKAAGPGRGNFRGVYFS